MMLKPENGMSEECLYALTGSTWKQVTQMKNMLSSMRNTNNCEVILFKLRSGNNKNIIAVLLDIPQPQRISHFSTVY